MIRPTPKGVGVKGGGMEGEPELGLRLLGLGVVGRSGIANEASDALIALVREGNLSGLRASCVGAATAALLLRFLVTVAGFFVSPFATPFWISVAGSAVFVVLRAERRRDMLICLYTVVETGRNAVCFNQWQRASI